MEQLRRRWQAVLVLLATLMTVTPASVAATAAPAAAQSRPECLVVGGSSIVVGGQCTNGDAGVKYRVVVFCADPLKPDNDPFRNYASSSGWVPTTQQISGIYCLFGGSITAAFVEVEQPPPPPSATLHCDSGGNRVFCTVEHGFSGPALITWQIGGAIVPAFDGRTSISATCNSRTLIKVTVVNSSGSDSGEWRNCRSGPWQ